MPTHTGSNKWKAWQWRRRMIERMWQGLTRCVWVCVRERWRDSQKERDGGRHCWSFLPLLSSLDVQARTCKPCTFCLYVCNLDLRKHCFAFFPSATRREIWAKGPLWRIIERSVAGERNGIRTPLADSFTMPNQMKSKWIEKECILKSTECPVCLCYTEHRVFFSPSLLFSFPLSTCIHIPHPRFIFSFHFHNRPLSTVILSIGRFPLPGRLRCNRIPFASRALATLFFLLCALLSLTFICSHLHRAVYIVLSLLSPPPLCNSIPPCASSMVSAAQALTLTLSSSSTLSNVCLFSVSLFKHSN